eukprot:GHVQ01028749.1.p1 GENE.GHVQ01028749.1~~GHVQ01028749.1.p1  ORF type:complete len:193 (+),score=33.82 GHVQ01028749.1:67-645(+)
MIILYRSTDIPGFRKSIIMAFSCVQCGARDNEVKASGAYGEKGKRWTLSVQDDKDMNRDVLKSDMAGIIVPSLGFEMLSGTQGGVFTTVEGLLTRTADNLKECNPFGVGDSADTQQRLAYDRTVQHLRKLASDPSMRPFDIVLDDPADHSFIGHRDPSHLHSPDPSLTSEAYDRTVEQDDELGLLDMKTEDY